MKKANDYIIFPLDVPSFDEAKKFIKKLTNHVGMFKVGLELFIKEGPEIIKYINNEGSTKVFLDLKLHDIPITVHRAVKRIASLDVALATVHCGDSRDMLEKAVSGSDNKVGILGVTVLTSSSGEDLKTAGYAPEFASDVSKLVLKKAAMAKEAGLRGIVCSGKEVGFIKAQFGKDFLAVTPGIRPLWDNVGNDDQSRVTTPADAVKRGSDYLVIGRPIRDASDPLWAVQKIVEEIEPAL